MSDTVSYFLILGAFVIPSFALIQLADQITLASFETIALLLSIPFP